MRSATLFLFACFSFAYGASGAIGVTRDGKPIPALIGEGDLDYNTRKTRVLVVGGLDGPVKQAFDWFHSSKEAVAYRKRFTVSAIPNAAANASYPPKGDAYASDPEAHYVWRWIGTHAPDVAVVVGGEARPDDLVSQLPRAAPVGAGPIPSVRLRAANSGFLKKFLSEWKGGPSPARLEIQRRLSRTPSEVARQLSATYGHELNEAVYIPAVALIGRLRLGALADVESIVAPYFDGRKNSLEKATGSHLSGHLVFGELAKLTGKARYVSLARAAADLGFDAEGRPKESMPMHSEMSDSLFMGCPILAQVGALTKDPKYFDMCVRHMRFMQKLTLRKDGIYRHSPLDETAWGRGNGFPALGLALSLADLPRDHPGRPEMLQSFQAHMAALLPHQDSSGMWRQVIDFDGSYRELTATCMIAFAMSRGIRAGWIGKDKYAAAIDRAWYGIRTRVAADGGLIDVCTGTGKQPNLRAYLDRTAILGPDPRGGAMALLIATELMEPGR